MHQSRLEVLVGFFVILALVVLTFMVFFISGVYVFKRGYHVNVLFNYVGNLERGASVRLVGIPVGSVSGLEIQYDSKLGRPTVKTALFIHQGVQIHQNAKIRIEGVYGLTTPRLEIRPGEDDNAPLVKEGDTLVGIDPVSMDDFAYKGQKIADHLEETIVRINHFVQDPEVISSLRATLINMNSLTTSMNSILDNKNGDLTKAVNNLEQSSQHLKNVMEKLDKGEGTAGKLLSDDTLYREIEDFVKDLKMHPWKLLKKGDEKKHKVLGIF